MGDVWPLCFLTSSSFGMCCALGKRIRLSARIWQGGESDFLILLARSAFSDTADTNRSSGFPSNLVVSCRHSCRDGLFWCLSSKRETNLVSNKYFLHGH